MNSRSSTSSRAIDVLVIEPNPSDARFLTTSIDRAGPSCTVHVVDDGAEALEFVHRRGEYATASQPDLVLFDLDPVTAEDGTTDSDSERTAGLETLSKLKSDPEFRSIPTIVLTDSTADEDVARSYRLGANAFVQKPDDPDEFADVIDVLTEFWLATVQLPPKE